MPGRQVNGSNTSADGTKTMNRGKQSTTQIGSHRRTSPSRSFRNPNFLDELLTKINAVVRSIAPFTECETVSTGPVVSKTFSSSVPTEPPPKKVIANISTNSKDVPQPQPIDLASMKNIPSGILSMTIEKDPGERNVHKRKASDKRKDKRHDVGGSTTRKLKTMPIGKPPAGSNEDKQVPKAMPTKSPQFQIKQQLFPWKN